MGTALKILFLLCLGPSLVLQAQTEEFWDGLIPYATSADLNEVTSASWLDEWMIDNHSGMDLNKITLSQLLQVPWISPLQARSFILYRSINGNFIDIYELQAIPGWDLTMIKQLLPLFKVTRKGLYYDPRKLGEKLSGAHSSYLLLRYKRQLERSKGYSDGKQGFLGPPFAVMSRLRIRKAGDFGIGLTLEQDAGEIWRGSTRKHLPLPDYYSAHLMLENKGVIRRLIIGDYQVQWDQGLSIGAGLNLGRQVITGIKNHHRGIFPHTSVSEANFRRGLGTEILLGSLNIQFFYSQQLLDAKVRGADSISQISAHVTSIDLSGLHRNLSEQSRKDQLPEQMTGLHCGISWNHRLRVGVYGLYQKFKWPIIPLGRRYQEFIFRGREKINLGFSLDFQWKNLNAFSQWSVSGSGGQAYILGVLAGLTSTWSMAMALRDFQRDFHSISPRALGVGSHNINERGVYWGLHFTPSAKWNFSAYLDLFEFPWLTVSADQPSFGSHGLLRFNYSPHKESELDLQWRFTLKEVNGDSHPGQVTNTLASRKKHQVILKGQWAGSSNMAIKSRLQWSMVNILGRSTQGFLAGQEFHYQLGHFKATAGTTLFQTDDFLNRQYVYEKDLLFSFSLPAYHGTGTRWYLVTKLKFGRKWQWWMRLARTKYNDQSHIGSGLDQINGSTTTEFKTQILLKL